MAVKRIVANLEAADPVLAASFYRDLLGLELAMDFGWIATFRAPEASRPQVSVAREGGSGTPVPRLSIEVDDFADTVERLQAAGVPFDYGPVREPWGVRRCFVRDPFGTLVNILAHDHGPAVDNGE